MRVCQYASQPEDGRGPARVHGRRGDSVLRQICAAVWPELHRVPGELRLLERDYCTSGTRTPAWSRPTGESNRIKFLKRFRFECSYALRFLIYWFSTNCVAHRHDDSPDATFLFKFCTDSETGMSFNFKSSSSAIGFDANPVTEELECNMPQLSLSWNGSKGNGAFTEISLPKSTSLAMSPFFGDLWDDVRR